MSTREVNYEFNVEDAVAVCQYHLDHPSAAQRRLLRLSIGLWVLAVVVLVALFVQPPEAFAGALPVLLVCTVLLALPALGFLGRRRLTALLMRRSLETPEGA